jgi:hypothetical protein
MCTNKWGYMHESIGGIFLLAAAASFSKKEILLER